MQQTLGRFFPLVRSLSGYDRQQFRGDMSAGLTTAVMLIPQAMAYAMLAGLPPYIGLYASTVPLFLYALFGTSRQLAVGPVAMVSLMVAAGVGAVAQPGSDQYLLLAVLLAGMVGAIQLLMGVARLGFLVNFLSHPVVSGFTSAAALIIGLSQLKHLLGVPIERSHHVHEILLSAARQVTDIQPITLAIGLGALALLFVIKKIKPTAPGALLVVVLSTLVVWLFGLHDRGVAIVGKVPAGLPGFSLPSLELAQIEELFPIALAIALVGFMESISVAKAFATKHRYEIDANKELVGLGVANLAGSLFSAYPVTGGFSRTAVNDQAGARTGLSSLLTALFVVVTLLLLTPLFTFLPKAVLAAIVMSAVFGLVDVKEVRHLWKVKRTDLVMLGLTFAATLGLGIEIGILTGVAASLLSLILKTTRPHVAVLGQVPGTHVFRNVERYPDAVQLPGIVTLRVDAPFYFANVNFLKATINRLQEGMDRPVRAIVLDASSINTLDASADAALHTIVRELRSRDVELFMAEVRGPVRDVMQRSGFVDLLGEERFTWSVRRAVENAGAHLASIGQAADIDPARRSVSRREEPDQGPCQAEVARRGVFSREKKTVDTHKTPQPIDI